MTTPQPASLRPSSPERYEEISRHLLQPGGGGAGQRRRPAGVGKDIWGATAHALKAIAQDRGWNHRFHNHMRAAAYYLALEWQHPQWNTSFDSFDSMHTNFYEHQLHPADLVPKLELAKAFCEELYGARSSEPPKDTFTSPACTRTFTIEHGTAIRTTNSPAHPDPTFE